MQDVWTRVIAFLKEYAEFDAENVTKDSQLIADLGLDSLDLVAMVDDAEERFGIVIDDEELMSIRRVGDIVRAVEEKSDTDASVP